MNSWLHSSAARKSLEHDFRKEIVCVGQKTVLTVKAVIAMMVLENLPQHLKRPNGNLNLTIAASNLEAAVIY